MRSSLKVIGINSQTFECCIVICENFYTNLKCNYNDSSDEFQCIIPVEQLVAGELELKPRSHKLTFFKYFFSSSWCTLSNSSPGSYIKMIAYICGIDKQGSSQVLVQVVYRGDNCLD